MAYITCLFIPCIARRNNSNSLVVVDALHTYYVSLHARPSLRFTYGRRPVPLPSAFQPPSTHQAPAVTLHPPIMAKSKNHTAHNQSYKSKYSFAPPLQSPQQFAKANQSVRSSQRHQEAQEAHHPLSKRRTLSLLSNS